MWGLEDCNSNPVSRDKRELPPQTTGQEPAFWSAVTPKTALWGCSVCVSHLSFFPSFPTLPFSPPELLPTGPGRRHPNFRIPLAWIREGKCDP